VTESQSTGSTHFCHALPALATSALRHFLRHFLEESRYCPAKPAFGNILLGELPPQEAALARIELHQAASIKRYLQRHPAKAS
jgi:hypothetical protein